MSKKGKFIVLEGGEGSGKTSIWKFLKDVIDNSENIVFTREPGGTSIGEKIRNLLMDKNNKDMLPITELFLFCGARAQHIEELIIPSLNSGKSQEGKTTRFDEEKLEFHRKVRKGFEVCFKKSNIDSPISTIWHRIDTDNISLDDAKKQTLHLVEKILDS